ncbi:nuclear transport factor 2 family protein [Streptomyces sp. V4I2]|uniref:nuclear transport factor 2 family protein n=1 Tax=Streptomyces sp. V4I2 TaxID=3042280 RepID=UPI002784AB5B|nr:nuclear transport factor 2 family protein [Streptomyces sp. V4I2]MDQ1043632.1 putative SnoaL-like aldol condensation-catalyzing enzyme [Streptomyces sp. V4I2]
MSNSTSRLPRKAIATLLAAATVGAVAGCAPAATATATTSAPSHSGLGLGLEAPYTSPATQERNKRVAVHVLTQLFEEGNLKVADRYLSEDYIQHNPAAPNGREAIKNFIREWTARFPDHQYNVKRVLAQGNLVLVHSNRSCGLSGNESVQPRAPNGLGRAGPRRTRPRGGDTHPVRGPGPGGQFPHDLANWVRPGATGRP